MNQSPAGQRDSRAGRDSFAAKTDALARVEEASASAESEKVRCEMCERSLGGR